MTGGHKNTPRQHLDLHLLRRCRIGLGVIRRRPIWSLLLLGVLVISGLCWRFRQLWFAGVPGNLADPILRLLLPAATGLALVFVLAVLGTPGGSRRIQENFRRIGLTNHAGETPLPLTRTKDGPKGERTIWVFDACGVPLDQWEARRSGLETALDALVVELGWYRGRSQIRVVAVPARNALPTRLIWRPELLPWDNFVLLLGEGFLGPVTVDLARVPHVLLGGSTGSGKSALLKLMLFQCLEKGARVWIADFKGGVDFSPAWQSRCTMSFDEEALLETLNTLVTELERRKEGLRQAGCANLEDFNTRCTEHSQRWPRLVFGCDEVAEVLDRTGRSRKEKERLGEIETRLATIARQGRAFGLHLMLATQRPDANVIPGQIRNNLDFRACGRADHVLSQIILDNTSAADEIPKDAQGRFITGDGKLFQAYWLEEGKVTFHHAIHQLRPAAPDPDGEGGGGGAGAGPQHRL